MTVESTPNGAGREGATASPQHHTLDVIRLITDRRSTRDGFTGEAVPTALIRLILECGLAAPSSKNAQPWRFHVVVDPDLLGRLADEVCASEGIDEYVPHDPVTGRPIRLWPSTVVFSANVMRSAPVAIFVENTAVFGGGRRALLKAPPDNVKSFLVGYGLEMLGLGAAIENILIASSALGVQAAFMGDILIAEQAFQRAMGMKGDLVGVIVLGYSDDTPPPRVHDVDDPERVHWVTPAMGGQAPDSAGA